MELLKGNELLLSDTQIQKLNSKLKTFKLFSLKVPKGIFSSNTNRVVIQFGSEYLWDMEIEENDLKSNCYKSLTTSENGIKEIEENILLFKGSLNNQDSSIVRLSLNNNQLEGYIFEKGEYFFVTPLNKMINQFIPDCYIIYKGSDIIDSTLLLTEDIVASALKTGDLKFLSINYSDPVKMLRIATDADYEFYSDHGSSTNSDILTIINMVEGIYETNFNMVFEVVYQHYYTTSNDPYTVMPTDSTSTAFLLEFRSYWNTNHTSVYRDVAHFFSGKPRHGFAGVGYRPGISPNSSFAYSSTLDGNLNHKIMAHELGHNFNAIHDDGENCSLSTASIMCPVLKAGTPYFSNSTITTINSYLIGTANLIEYTYFDSNYMCGSETFSISNVPSGYTVTWPKSSNLGFSGSSTGSPVTIVATSGGDSWVEPTLTRGGVSVSFSKDEFWAGSPNSSHMTLKLFNTDGSIAPYMCANTHYQIFIYNNSPCSTTDYTWSIPSAWTKNYAYSNYISVYTNSIPGGMVEVYANTCCEDNVNVKTEYFGSGYCGGYYSMMFTPNPTTGETTLSIESENREKTFDETAVWELEIYSPAQVLTQKTTKLRGSSTTIQTASWKEGVYTVRVKLTTKEKPDEILIGKLVVRK